MRDEAEMATIGLIAGGGLPAPYLVIFEYDGGPDHKLYHIANQIYLFAVLLVGNMDKLVATRGCPGLSYLNTSERAMDTLKIGLSGLEI